MGAGLRRGKTTKKQDSVPASLLMLWLTWGVIKLVLGFSGRYKRVALSKNPNPLQVGVSLRILFYAIFPPVRENGGWTRIFGFAQRGVL